QRARCRIAKWTSTGFPFDRQIPPRRIAGRDAARSGCLEVYGARATALVVLEVISHALLAIQGAQTSSFDCTDVHEGIAASVLRLDEAVTLVGVEKLYGSSDHFDSSFCGGPPIGPPMLGEAREGKGAAKRRRPSDCDH